VTFTDGSSRYDNDRRRRHVLQHPQTGVRRSARTDLSDKGIYRFATERDPSIDQLHVFVGPTPGLLPLSKDAMYLFTTTRLSAQHADHEARRISF
jgi:hypothetical protein